MNTDKCLTEQEVVNACKTLREWCRTVQCKDCPFYDSERTTKQCLMERESFPSCYGPIKGYED